MRQSANSAVLQGGRKGAATLRPLYPGRGDLPSGCKNAMLYKEKPPENLFGGELRKGGYAACWRCIL